MLKFLFGLKYLLLTDNKTIMLKCYKQIKFAKNFVNKVKKLVKKGDFDCHPVRFWEKFRQKCLISLPAVDEEI